MIGVQGFGAVQEPTGPKHGPGRAKESDKTTNNPEPDGVSFSAEAEQVAETTSVAADSGIGNQIRQERVERAKESIEEGTYKIQDVVRQVASRLTKFVS
ncbi:flagellar biosynthesis anti-sigma factor FlgM [bacterium AH-315-P07]|nr:flagellar biosynthesis anti-sigma factor FlgM [bacterium AH-315-P07]